MRLNIYGSGLSAVKISWSVLKILTVFSLSFSRSLRRRLVSSRAPVLITEAFDPTADNSLSDRTAPRSGRSMYR